ncbi:MAG: hypothetical protein KC713_07885, partial [Candidatus Omnitrophica bacterium]|nr:hypothetical protein [Candidatus Omnitrophota bacterium]
FMLFSLIYFVYLLVPKERWVNVLCVSAVIIASLASYGLFYRPVESRYYSYIHTERSLEYRNEMRLHEKIVRQLKESYPAYSVGAPFITAHILAYPELGYVKTPFDVVIYNMNVAYEGIRNFPGLKNLDIKNHVWIGFIGNIPGWTDFPVDPKDKVLEEVYAGNKYATLFRGGFAIEKFAAFVYSQQQLREEILRKKIQQQ